MEVSRSSEWPQQMRKDKNSKSSKLRKTNIIAKRSDRIKQLLETNHPQVQIMLVSEQA
jgi:hypothetical protein